MSSCKMKIHYHIIKILPPNMFSDQMIIIVIVLQWTLFISFYIM